MNNTPTPAATPRATPRTDAEMLCRRSIELGHDPNAIHVDFARALERESAAQSELIAEMRAALSRCEKVLSWVKESGHEHTTITRAINDTRKALHRAREAKKGGV